MVRWKRRTAPAMNESVPLMSPARRGRHSTSGDAKHGVAFASEDESTEEEEDIWLDVVVDPNKRNKGAALIATDAILLILNYLQMYAMLQSLALRWPWPESWLSRSYYLFLANADIWEFLKLHTPGVFLYVQDYFVSSFDIPISYRYLAAACGGFLLLLVLLYIACYIGFSRRKTPGMLVRLSTLRQVFIVCIQIHAIPVGVAVLRLFHCTDGDVVDVLNEVYCFRGMHWAFLAPTLAVLALIFIAFPTWIIMRTKAELLNMNREQHEGYLQLREMEYVHGLDIGWVIGNFHIFASFHKEAVHFRACHLIAQAVILVFYAGLFQYSFIQAVVINCSFFLLFLVFLVLRPFRIQAFNVLLVINYLCLSANCLLGCFKTSYDFSTVQSPWLLPQYQFIILLIINGFWLLVVIVFVVYVIAKTCCCHEQGLWPYTKFDKLSPQTRKYVKGVIISRLLVEKTLSVHPMFAPVHEVARYIHIINAYCREAEILKDPLHNTLWDALDELIEIHTNIAPKSLFAESTKDSIRRTATEFMVLMPAFVRRLAQREYDLILVNPVKRMLLLKLYCLSVFLRLRKVRRDHLQLTMPAVQKIWTKADEDESDPGYYEDMYPPREPIMSQRTYNYDADVLIRLDEEFEDDEDVIEETENWLQRHGVPRSQRSDPLDEWMEQIGVSAARPDTVVTEFTLPENFTIPGLTYVESEFDAESRQASAVSRPGSSTSRLLGTSQSRPPSALSPAPSAQSRPSSALSRASMVARQPAPGTRTPSGSGGRPDSAVAWASPAPDVSSLPGAVATDDDLQSVRSGSQASVSLGTIRDAHGVPSTEL